MTDWFNTGLMRDLGYNLVYPQLYPHHKRRSDEAQAGTIAWGQAGANKWLLSLDQHWLGAGQTYLCGDQITIADYFSASAVTLAELIDCDFSQFPNASRWLSKMKKTRELGLGRSGVLSRGGGQQGQVIRGGHRGLSAARR